MLVKVRSGDACSRLRAHFGRESAGQCAFCDKQENRPMWKDGKHEYLNKVAECDAGFAGPFDAATPEQEFHRVGHREENEDYKRNDNACADEL